MQGESGYLKNRPGFRHIMLASLLLGMISALSDVSYIASRNTDLALDLLVTFRFLISATIMTSLAFLVCLIPVLIALSIFSRFRIVSLRLNLTIIYFIGILPIVLLISRNFAIALAGSNLLVPEIKAYYYFLKYIWIIIPSAWAVSSWISAILTANTGREISSKLSSFVLATVTFLILTPYMQANLIDGNTSGGESGNIENLLITIIPLIIALLILFLLRPLLSRLASIANGKPVVIMWIILILLPFLQLAVSGESYVGTIPSGEPLSGREANVILISLDTFRYDDVGCFGSEIVSTPTLDSLAENGICFDNAITPMPVTGPAHTSILTGLQPDSGTGHGVRSNGIQLEENIPTLATILDLAGYRTGAIIGGSTLSRAASGLQRGFHYYHDSFDDSLRARIFKGYLWSLTLSRLARRFYHDLGIDIFWVSKRADTVTDQSIGWLEKNSDQPFFLFVHYYDAHDPYDPPPPYDSMYDSELAIATPDPENPGEFIATPGRDRGLYRGEISYVDHELGRLLDWCRNDDLFDNTLFVVVSDHGESFEHNYAGHVRRVYETLVHVPLIVYAPEGDQSRSGGTRVDTLVNISDIAPTILDYLGVENPGPGSENQDIFGAIPDGEHDLLKIAGMSSEGHIENNMEGWAFVPSQSDAAASTDGYRYGQFFSFRYPDAKLIYGPDALPLLPGYQYFNLVADPGEMNDLFPGIDWSVEFWHSAPEDLSEWASNQEILNTAGMDDITRAQLEALGYINN